MSQLNLDILNLAPPVGACPPANHRSDAPSSDRFDQHLDRAGRAGGSNSSQSDDALPEAKPAKGGDAAPSAAKNAGDEAEPEANSHDDKPSDAARSETKEESKASAPDEDERDTSKEEKKDETGNAECNDVLLAAVAITPQNRSEPSQAIGESEIVVGPSELGSDNDAKASVESIDTTLEPEAPPEPTKAEAVAAEAETAPSPVDQAAVPVVLSVSAADADTEPQEPAQPAVPAPASATSPKHRETRAAKAPSDGPATQTAAVAGPAAQPSAESAPLDAAGGNTKHVERHIPREADAASIRPTPAAVHGTADAAQSGIETPAPAPSAGQFAARPQATGSAPQTGAATTNPSLPPADTTDRVRFVQRVSRAVEAASSRGGSVRLRLHPPDLGSLHVELSVRRGEMTARLQTESSDVRNLLLDNLPALRQRLAEHNITVGRFDVGLGLGTSGGSPQGAGNPWQGYENQAYAGNIPGRQDEGRVEAAAGPPTRTVGWGTSQFDVII